MVIFQTVSNNLEPSQIFSNRLTAIQKNMRAGWGLGIMQIGRRLIAQPAATRIWPRHAVIRPQRDPRLAVAVTAAAHALCAPSRTDGAMLLEWLQPG